MGDRAPRGRKVTTKLFVGNLPETCRRADLLVLFEQHGKVTECDIVKDYAFVHYADPDDAKLAAGNLNNADFNGSKIRVELSHSTVRHKAGMGDKTECYKCGKEGHWSKDCPTGGSLGRGGGGGGGGASRDYGRDYGRDSRAGGRVPPRYSPYAAQDPYDPYYSREQLLRRRPLDRLMLLERVRRMPHRNPYFEDPDPYARPPPDYYQRSRAAAAAARDPYYDLYSRAALLRTAP